MAKTHAEIPDLNMLLDEIDKALVKDKFDFTTMSYIDLCVLLRGIYSQHDYLWRLDSEAAIQNMIYLLRRLEGEI